MPSHKHGSIDLARSAMLGNTTTKRCVESSALPAGFAGLEYPKALSYPIISKNSMAFRTQRIGWLITWKP